MPEPSFSQLHDIFRMVEPSGFDSRLANALGQGGPEVNANRALSEMLAGMRGNGFITTEQLILKLRQLITDASDEQKSAFNKNVQVYTTLDKSVGNVDPATEPWYKMYSSADGETRAPAPLHQVVGLDENAKPMAIILSNAPLLTPATRNTGKAEIFLNSIPSHILSRCVPYLSVEMVADRLFNNESGGPLMKLAAPSLLRFLMGGDQGVEADTPNAAMLGANSRSEDIEPGKGHALTVGGMELFTAPQTLVDPRPMWDKNRYTPVLDPFRPFASIESLNINAHGTFGLMSYRNATLQLKLHDRSRLAELADFVQPLTYTKTTVWITYGWRHPHEPGNPYADFINNNMLVREAYGVVNSQFSFDDVGQVAISLNLFTKGVRELQDVRYTDLGKDGSVRDVQNKIQGLVTEISRLRVALGLDKPTGVSREIRGSTLLEAGSTGDFPNLNQKEVKAQLDAIKASLTRGGNGVFAPDSDAKRLFDSLSTLYSKGSGEDAKFDYQARLEAAANTATQQFMEDLRQGDDPFELKEKKLEEREKQTQQSPQNAYVRPGQTPTRQQQTSTPSRGKTTVGKIVSSVLARAVNKLDNIDEFQLLFYPFNDTCGDAAGQNIASFPIDLGFFEQQVAEHIARRKSGRITALEFLRLLFDAQLKDVRAEGYGFSAHFEPYDPKKKEATLKPGQANENEFESKLNNVESGKGRFVMPALEMYAETAFAHTGDGAGTPAGGQLDLLRRFELMQTELLGDQDPAHHRGMGYKRVMRIHVFDKTVDPYPLATTVLREDHNNPNSRLIMFSTPELKEKTDAVKAALGRDANESGADNALQGALSADEVRGYRLDLDLASNAAIKEFVSTTVPRLVYGTNATGVKSANLSSKQDALLAASQMIAGMAGRPSVMQPNGGGASGLPLRIIPASMQMTTFGCPLIDFAQIWFVDFNTGTTVDNLYNVTGITHTITPGNFETQLTMTYADAYGKYEGAPSFWQYAGLFKDKTKDVPE